MTELSWHQQDEFIRTAEDVAQTLPPMCRFDFIQLARRLATNVEDMLAQAEQIEGLQEEVRELEKETAEKDTELEDLRMQLESAEEESDG